MMKVMMNPKPNLPHGLTKHCILADREAFSPLYAYNS
jgi:hypothetical protein